MMNFWRKPVTECYPENRHTLQMSDRFRAVLTMPHNANNEHKCTACGICQLSCPNDTIQVISKTEAAEDGKTKKVLDRHVYKLGQCTFCNLCVMTCPSGAIVFSQDFEQSVYTRSKLTLQLNQPGSVLEKKQA
jgi:NADH-quinone oxidoreductase subunit I